MGGHLLLHLYNSSRASMLKRFTAYFPLSVKRYESTGSHGDHGVEDRAPSTEEEFKRAAEAKQRDGFASQTLEKAEDAAEEATKRNSDSESVKKSYKEPPGKGNFHRTGDGVSAEDVPSHI